MAVVVHCRYLWPVLYGVLAFVIFIQVVIRKKTPTASKGVVIVMANVIVVGDNIMLSE